MKENKFGIDLAREYVVSVDYENNAEEWWDRGGRELWYSFAATNETGPTSVGMRKDGVRKRGGFILRSREKDSRVGNRPIFCQIPGLRD